MWFDSAHVELVRDAFPEWMAFLFAFLSYLGSVWFVAPAVVLAYWFHDRHRFADWIGIVMGGYAIMVGLKGLFATPRPDVGPAIAPESLPLVVALLYAPAVEVHTTSFPSGHAMAAVIVWTMLALEFDVGTRRQRLLGAAAMVVLVSFARIGAGVHYPIDVVGGALLGVAYVAAMVAMGSRLRRRDRRVATTATFALGAALSILAFLASGQPDAMALLGGCLGALVAWQVARPQRKPWSVTPRVLLHAAGGIALLGLAASVLIVADSAGVWLGVGLVGGLVILGLPRIASRTATGTSPAEVAS